MNTPQARRPARQTRVPDPAARRGRGKAQCTLDLINACRDILSEIQPATVRAACYQLFVRKLIPDMGKGSTNKVSRALVYAREQGSVPWEWIVDETREMERVPQWANPEGIIRSAVSQYRRDNWQDQRNRVLIMSEKGTVRGTLAPVLHEYGVNFQVVHGFSSATTLRDAAVDSASSDKPLTIVYVGDHDPSGRCMSDVDIPTRLARYGGLATVQRVAITAADLDSDLPWFPAADKQTDTRYQWFTERYGNRCVELDALPPPILRERVESAIVAMLDTAAWDYARMIERAETASIQQVIGAWKSISGQASKYSDGGSA